MLKVFTSLNNAFEEIPSDSDSSRRPSQAPSDVSPCSPSPSISSFNYRRRPSHHGEIAAAVSLLGVPSSRSRGDSLPGDSVKRFIKLHKLHFNISTSNDELLLRDTNKLFKANISGNIDDDQLYTLRNFHMKGKKIINRGDSVKSRSRTSLNSRRSR